MEQKIKSLQGQFRYLWPNTDDQEIRNIADAMLVYIEEIHEMTEAAGYFVKYQYISGPKFKVNTRIVTDSAEFTQVGYAYMTQLANREALPKEKWLNEKLNPPTVVTYTWPYTYTPAHGGTVRTNDFTLPQGGSTIATGSSGQL